MVKSLLDEIAANLRRVLPGLDADRNASWRNHTTLGAGIAPFFLVRPRTLEELLALLTLLRAYPVSVRILGAGSNFVGSDTEQATIVIRLDNGYFTRIFSAGKNMLECRSGVRLGALAQEAAKRGLGGFSALSGIPGTVGGAIRMNAGACGVELSRFVRMIEGVRLKDNSLYLWDTSQGGWGYRNSPVPQDVIITGTVLEFSPADPESEQTLIQQEIIRRAKVTPKGRSAGSVFRNPESAAAGQLLEQSGCKEMENGAFHVSRQHANWIVSEEKEAPLSEQDFLKLVSRMHTAVLNQAGINLKPELCFANPDSEKTIC